MLGRLLRYAGSAFMIQTITGLLTYVAEMYVAGSLTELQYGEYKHYFLIYSLIAGPFIVGFDHGLITYVTKEEKNYGAFLRLLLPYCFFVSALCLLAAFVSTAIAAPSTVWGIACVGPFVFISLGYITLRAHWRVKQEFALLCAQSLAWSLGSLIMIRFFKSEMVPIALSAGTFAVTTTIMTTIFIRDLAKEKRSWATAHPFGAEYKSFWTSFGPLWIAGAAFLVNNQITAGFIDGTLGRVELGMWGVVGTTMLFIAKPLQIIQRITLPILSREKGEIFTGFKHLVQLNLLFFPLLAIGVLGAYPLLLSFKGLGKYSSTWPLLAVVIAASPSMAVEFVVAAVSMARNLPHNNRNAHVLTACFNVPITWILVKFWGLWGAALSQAVYTILFGGTMFWFTRKDLPEFVRFAVKNLAAALVALVGAILLMAYASSATLAALPAMALYLFLSWIFGVWRWREFAELLKRSPQPK